MKDKGKKKKEDYTWSKHAKQVAEDEDLFYQVNEQLKKQKSTTVSEKGIPQYRFYKQKNRKGKGVVYVKELESVLKGPNSQDALNGEMGDEKS